jgi:hypothetical protein
MSSQHLKGGLAAAAAVESATLRAATVLKPSSPPSDQVWEEHIRLAWELEPTLAIYIITRFHGIGPWTVPTPAPVHYLSGLVRRFSDRVANCPTALEFSGLRDVNAAGGNIGGGMLSGGSMLSGNGGTGSSGIIDPQHLVGWAHVPAPKALELVRESTGTLVVFKYAAVIIAALSPTEIVQLIPQLVQLLALDTDHIWVNLLVTLAARSHHVRKQLVWHLSAVAEHVNLGRSAQHVLAQLVFGSTEGLARAASFDQDHAAFERVCMLPLLIGGGGGGGAWGGSSGGNGGGLSNHAQHGGENVAAALAELVGRCLPCDTSAAVIAKVVQHSFRAPHATVTFLTDANTAGAGVEVTYLFTRGVDHRAEMVVMQVMQVLNEIFEHAKLKASAVTANILAAGMVEGAVGRPGFNSIKSGSKIGFIQLQPGVEPVMGGSVHHFLLERHRNELPEMYRQVLEQSVRSLAVCTLCVYLLNLKPPTLQESIWIDGSGRLGLLNYHSMFLPETWVSTWVIPEVDLNLNDFFFTILGIEPASNGPLYKLYADTFIQAFLAARLRQDQFLPLVVLMSNADLDHFKPHRVDVLRARLLPGKTDAEAVAILRSKYFAG